MTGRGRPRKGELIRIRIEAEALAAIDAYAGEQGISRAEAVRRIVDQWIRTQA